MRRTILSNRPQQPSKVWRQIPLALLLLGACSSRACSSPEPELQQPDVLFLVVDTLRADRLGSYGYERGLTPVMDRLAQEGAVFTRASSQAPWTVPSMCSMITSQYPTAHFERPEESRTTLAEAFQQAGYTTVGVVANALLDPGTGFERGFDVYIPREGTDGKRKMPGHFDAVASWADSALVSALARDENGKRKPLFLYAQPSDPHAPYHGRQAFLADQPVSSVPPILPEKWQEQMLGARGPAAPDDDPGWSMALQEIQRQRNAYDHDVRFTDAALGRWLKRLEELGADNLLVVIASDHGEELWENVTPAAADRLKEMPPNAFFFQSHGYSLAEQALRTPIILSGPGVPAGRKFAEPVENVDLFPTLVTLCGLERPDDLHGLDLTPLMQGRVEPGDWRLETYSYVIHGFSMRDETSGLKLTLPTPYGMDKGLSPPQMFDLNADPLERTNLLEQRPQDANRLTQRLMQYLERYDSGGASLDGTSAEEMRRRMQEMGYAGLLVGEDEGDE
jgi:arylsulfatase A-like enzyme